MSIRKPNIVNLLDEQNNPQNTLNQTKEENMEDAVATSVDNTPAGGHVIDVDTSDALEMGPVPPGEYKVQILKAEYKSGEGAAGPWSGINLALDIPDEVTAEIFNSMVWLPTEGQEEKRFQRAKSDFDKFKKALQIGPAEVFTIEDLVGREAWAYLTVKQDSEYGDQNRVQYWITGPAEKKAISY